MDYHIILLPRLDYWAWVRSCKDYIVAFGPNLTPDPETAARYMAPHQVITFPYLPGAFPEQGDIFRWFEAHHPGIRLDPIEVGLPADLTRALQPRVETRDRYGQRLRPFYLLWPTNYPVITQKFGANPQIYNRWGLPGHEGLDLRALTNTDIYACADGEVYEVNTKPKAHPYGIHVRIRHRDGYRTVYGHLARALVKPGDVVKAGEVIGKADATGNSAGAHLHLSLKRDGATEREETKYPKDLIDPTPFMVWPETPAAKALGSSPSGSEICRAGAHGRVGGVLQEADLLAVRVANLEAIKISLEESRETIEKLSEIRPGIFVVARLTTDFSQDSVSALRFCDAAEADLGRLYRLGVRDFEVHATPNLQVEGWMHSWRTGAEFGDWFMSVAERLKRTFPESRLGFPGLSPGEHVSGQREDASHFLQEAETALASADWIGVNAHWMNDSGMLAIDGGRTFDEYLVRFPDRWLMVTEFCNPSPNVPASTKARQYVDFYEMLRRRTGVVAAFCYTLSASSGLQAVAWRSEEGILTEIPAIIGARSARQAQP